jgi:hypothetical protein
MGHLIPMNLQFKAEVGDRGVVKRDIVPSSGGRVTEPWRNGWTPT